MEIFKKTVYIILLIGILVGILFLQEDEEEEKIQKEISKQSAIEDNSEDIEWQGFYHENQEIKLKRNNIEEKAAIEEAPTFSSLRSCINWGKDLLVNNQQGGFDCSYGCRFEEDIQTIVCKDTTGMITELEKQCIGSC